MTVPKLPKPVGVGVVSKASTAPCGSSANPITVPDGNGAASVWMTMVPVTGERDAALGTGGALNVIVSEPPLAGIDAPTAASVVKRPAAVTSTWVTRASVGPALVNVIFLAGGAAPPHGAWPKSIALSQPAMFPVAPLPLKLMDVRLDPQIPPEAVIAAVALVVAGLVGVNV